MWLSLFSKTVLKNSFQKQKGLNVLLGSQENSPIPALDTNDVPISYHLV